MMKSKHRLIILCLLVLTILSSCTYVMDRIPNVIKKLPDEPEQVEELIAYTDITKGANYKDFIQGSRSLVEFETYTTEKLTYYFELNKYSKEQINKLISSYENLRTRFETEFNIVLEKPLFLFISDSINFGTEDGKIYLNTLDTNTIEVTTVFLHALFGDTSNYGLVYGLACHIHEALYKTTIEQSIAADKLKDFYSNSRNLTLMDLTIPVFQSSYFSVDQNKYSYSTAYYFTKALIEKDGLDKLVSLIKESLEMNLDFDIKYTEIKNEWLKSIGATESCEVPTIPMRFKQSLKRNADIYPYAIYTQSTISFITPNDNYYHEGTVMSYDYAKKFLTMYEQDVTALREYLAPYIDTNKPVIKCSFKHKDDGMNYYHSDEEGITYSAPLYAGAHEYAHFLTANVGADLPVWITEGIADYCANYLENNGVYRMKQEYYSKFNDSGAKYYFDKNIEAKNEYIENSYLLFYNELKAYNNSKITGDDKDTISSVYFNAARIGDEDERSLSYSEAASLVNYLIKNYGEEKFFELYRDYSKLAEIYSKPFSELKQEWLTKLQSSLVFN